MVKKGSFAVALGIVAVDGLLCAFVSMLTLALVVMSSQQTAASAPLGPETAVFTLEKESADAAPISSHFLLTIESADQSQFVRFVSSNKALSEVPAVRGSGLVQTNGYAMWGDDFSASARNATAMFVVVRPRGRWRLKVLVATTDDSFSDAVPAAVTLRVHRAGTDPKATLTLNLKNDVGAAFCQDWGQAASVPTKC